MRPELTHMRPISIQLSLRISIMNCTYEIVEKVTHTLLFVQLTCHISRRFQEEGVTTERCYSRGKIAIDY